MLPMVGRSFFRRYTRIWLQIVAMRFATLASARFDFFCYVIGKFVRMGFFFILVVGLFSHVNQIAGYTRAEVFLFFAIMNVLDILVQLFFFRGFSDFHRVVLKGDFDFVLSKPFSPLFWAGFRMFDFIDLTTVPVAALFLWYAFSQLGSRISIEQAILGSITLLIAVVLAFAVQTCFAAWTFWSANLNNTWWLYRHTTYALRFPSDIFPQAVQWLFTYIFPAIVIVIFPTKAFLGTLSTTAVVWLFVVTILWLIGAVLFWRRGVRHYTSASS